MPLLFSAFLRGLTLTGKGDYADALATFREGLELSEKVGDEAIHHRLLNCLGWLHFELGDLDGATELNRRSADVGRRRNDPGTLPNAELNLGDIFLARGDLPLAREMLDARRPVRARPGHQRLDAFPLLDQAQREPGRAGARAQGDLDRARGAGPAVPGRSPAARTRARTSSRGGGSPARSRARPGGGPEAERALREARTVAETIGNPTQLWRTYAALARCHADQGQEDAARRAAGEAGRVLDRIVAGLPDERLRASLEGLALVREVRARAGRPS